MLFLNNADVLEVLTMADCVRVHEEGEVDDALLQGLDRRAFRLLRADESEWVRWLDEDGFWKPGWGSGEATE